MKMKKQKDEKRCRSLRGRSYFLLKLIIYPLTMFALICYFVSNKRTCIPERYTQRLLFKHAVKDCGSNRYQL